MILLTLCVGDFSSVQRSVFTAYRRAFALRGVFIQPQPTPGAGRCLFSAGSPIVDRKTHCYWNCGDNAGIDGEAGDCGWLWHHGPSRAFGPGDPRVILLPRNDLFEIRGIDNSLNGWAEYRERIDIPWPAKKNEIYFRGHFTGEWNVDTNARVRVYRLLQRTGLPENFGLLAESMPPEFAAHVPIKAPDPLHAIAQHKFVLSLWGNHPFNPRLYRGLEGGSLVFHQATPSVHLLDDGVLEPGRHYVEIAADLSDLVEKLTYFVARPDEARAIADAGREAWMQTLFTASPYRMSDLVWQRFVGQPNWAAFLDAFRVH